MQNVVTSDVSLLSRPRLQHTAAQRAAAVCDSGGGLQLLYATNGPTGSYVVRASRDASLAGSWDSANLTQFLRSPQDMLFVLDADAGALEPVLAGTREGSLVAIDPETGSPELVGEVVDVEGRHEFGGLLALRRSPDGGAVVVVSPSKAVVLTAGWDMTGEYCFGEQEDQLLESADVKWCTDGSAFVIVFWRRSGVSAGRVFDRDVEKSVALDVGELQGDGFCTAVAWQPTYGGILCVSGPGRSVTCFEKNGLRHQRNDFETQSVGETELLTRMLQWSPDGRLLAAELCSAEGDMRRVHVYERSNYKWYLRQAFVPQGDVASLLWDSERPRSLIILLSSGEAVSCEFRQSYAQAGSDCGLCAVIDGSCVRVTDFERAVIPPPMCHQTLGFSEAVVSVSMYRAGAVRMLGALLISGTFAVVNVDKVLEQRRRGDYVEVDVRRNGKVANGESFLQILRKFKLQCPLGLSPGLLSIAAGRSQGVLLSETLMCTVERCVEEGREAGTDVVQLYSLSLDTDVANVLNAVDPGGKVILMQSASLPEATDLERPLLVATSNSQVLVLGARTGKAAQPALLRSGEAISCEAARDAAFMDCCSVKIDSRNVRLLFVMDGAGLLQTVDCDSRRVATLSRECTSFCLTPKYVVFTTRSHVMHCVAIYPTQYDVKSDAAVRESVDRAVHEQSYVVSMVGRHVDTANAVKEGSGMQRPIDRGSIVLCALPCRVRVMLQAPRGNLEVISPRPIVVAEVRRLALLKQYGAAFRLSRKQRIDMNVMVEANSVEFLKSIPDLVDDIGNPNHLSVFLSYLRETDKMVNMICTSVFEAIQSKPDATMRRDLVTAAITASLTRRPRCFADALRLVQDCFSCSEEQGLKALDFLLVLGKDEAKVYEEALGTYDLSLSLMVAKASQLDPQDYSAELRALHRMSEGYRMYTIDVKLERFSSALRHLYSCGTERRQECLDFAKERTLFEDALSLFKDDDSAVLELRSAYGVHLVCEGRYGDAASVYVLLGRMDLAAKSYKDAGSWRLALSAFSQFQKERAAPEQNDDDSDARRNRVWREFVSSLADDLAEAGHAVDASYVRVSHLQDPSGALEDLLKAEEWDHAYELSVSTPVCVHNANDVPLLSRTEEELRVVLADVMSDLRDSQSKFKERLQRLSLIRETKARMKSALGTPGHGAGTDADSDAFSAASTAQSAYSGVTDMTFASSTASAHSQTSLYSSVGRGRGGRARAAQVRKAQKVARKRIRAGHPQEEDALVASLRRLVPNAHVRRRVGRVVRGAMHVALLDDARHVVEAMEDLLETCLSSPEDFLDDKEVTAALTDDSWRFGLVGILSGRGGP